MARSPEAIERRLAYTRAWFVRHPGYRRKAAGRRGRATTPTIHPPVVHGVTSGHPLLEQAMAVAGPRGSSFRTLYDPTYDDLVMDIVVALLEHRCPVQARSSFRSREIDWRTHHVQVRDGFEPYAGRLIPQGAIAGE